MFWHDMGWGGMWFGWFFWIVLIVLIIWAIVRFSNQKSNGSSNLTHRETPLDILKEDTQAEKLLNSSTTR